MDDQIIQTKRSRKTKFAIFDFDWTIVKPKSGQTFPKDAGDWQYLRKSVKQTLQTYAKTYQIVIVTDQSKPWKIEQIQQFLQDVQIEPITVIIGGKTKKPDTSLFLSVFPTIQKEKAFYVGDAAGRKGDWSDRDRVFAERLGVPFYTPEQIFPLDTSNRIPFQMPKAEGKEVVIMVGYPGSGKSTIAKSLGYFIVDGDTYKTSKKMVSIAKQHKDQSIVFDSTAGTKERRAEFVQYAKDEGLPVRTIWVQTPIDISMEQNKQRAAEGIKEKIPDIAFYIYRKKFEEPTEDEGFTLIKVPYP